MSLKESIDKATSSELTEDDYSLLLDVVDTVKSNTDTNIQESISIIKTKLESNDANVILRTITLIDFLAENCGAMMRGEIAKKSFVNNYMVKLINDSRMHNSIKFAVIKEIYKLSKTFRGDESLKVMEDTFKDLKNSYLYLCQQAISEVDGGSRSTHQSLNNTNSTEEEDEELRRAIEMSLKDSQRGYPQSRPLVQSAPEQQAPAISQSPVQQQQQQPITTQQPIQQEALMEQEGPDKVKALYDLTTNDDDTLSFKKDDIITVVENVNEDWLRGCLNGKLGIIPNNYVEKIPKTTTKDIKELTATLNQSFNVEVLLSKLMDLKSKLATNPVANNEFEQILIRDEIPSKLDGLEKTRNDLKKMLDMCKLKIMELESMEKNIDSSVGLYQKLCDESRKPSQQYPQQQALGQYPTGLNQQMNNLSINPTATGNNSNNPYTSLTGTIQSSTTGSMNPYTQQNQITGNQTFAPQQTGGYQYPNQHPSY